jgi:hypothetical protein
VRRKRLTTKGTKYTKDYRGGVILSGPKDHRQGVILSVTWAYGSPKRMKMRCQYVVDFTIESVHSQQPSTSIILSEAKDP